MSLEQRALYTSLRMNWLLDRTGDIEEWQVANYREMPLEEIFTQLQDLGIPLDQPSFHSLAEAHDTPEDLVIELLEDAPEDQTLHDHVYLLIFELWRRLAPEKPCLSVFCDELDHQIYLYDQSQLEDVEPLEDMIANLQIVLDENVDSGMKPDKAFAIIASGCANDIESFLYDFIAEQIDQGNVSYANELVEAFIPYASDAKWFEFLRIRLTAENDNAAANELTRDLLRKTARHPDLELYLEILSFMVQSGEKELFAKVVHKALDHIENEEELQDLLEICIDFYRCLDCEKEEKELQALLEKREGNSLESSISKQDPSLGVLSRLI